MVEQGQGIEWMGALHRAARLKKSILYFLIYEEFIALLFLNEI